MDEDLGRRLLLGLLLLLLLRIARGRLLRTTTTSSSTTGGGGRIRRHTAPGHRLEQTLDLRCTGREGLDPEIIVTTNQFHERDQ